MFKKIISLLLALAMITPTVVWAETPPPKPRAKVVAQHKGGMFSRPYVEFEINGEIFKSNEIGQGTNRQLFAWLSDEDKMKVFKSYGNYTDRYHHFGPAGQMEIADWAGANTEWKEAGRIWQDRIAKKNFPELFAFYESPPEDYLFMYNDRAVTMKDMVNESVPFSFTHPVTQQSDDYAKFQEQYVRFQSALAYGKACYDVCRSAKVNQVQTAVKSLSKGLLEMITDNMFVPRVTLPRTSSLYSGAIADLTKTMMDLGWELIELTDLLKSYSDPDPVDIINQMTKMIEKNEVIAKEMEQVAKDTLLVLCDLIPKLEEADKQNKQKYADRYNEELDRVNDKINESKIIPTSYNFTPKEDYKTEPVKAREEVRVYIEGQIKAIGAFNPKELNEAIEELGKTGSGFYIGNSSFPFGTPHSTDPIYYIETLGDTDFDGMLGRMDRYGTNLLNKNIAIEKLGPASDKAVEDYRNKVSR